MKGTKIILPAVLIFVAAFSARAQKTNDWTIGDYLKNLPEKYKTFSGDFLPPTKDSTNIDEENGYAAFFESQQPGTSSFAQGSPIFEMALFKSQTKQPLLIVSNLKSDAVCTEYETFFLRRVGRVWSEVEREVLPPRDLKMFWDAPKSAEKLLKIIKQNSISYHFEPPRNGTRMKMSLEICDYVEDDTPNAAHDELRRLIESAKAVYLDWDKQNGKFNFAK